MNCYEKISPINIYEKSNSIAIPISNKNNLINNEYSLKQSIFDPFQGSPPNEFMIKLKKRMSTYNSFLMNDVSRNSE
jgi:hypothetical protein